MDKNFLKLKIFLNGPLNIYDKSKVNLLKTILPTLIIIHHISSLGFVGVERIGSSVHFVMCLFFAMSGYGLTISYLNSPQYLNNFIKKSIPKLFLPYLFALLLFVIYRYIKGVDQIDLLKTKGFYFFVPTSWYIWVLSYFYIFFYFIFRYVKTIVEIKVLLTCCLVMGYYFLAPRIGIEPWRWERCPGFCAGMIFALFDFRLRKYILRWQAILMIVFIIILLNLPYAHKLNTFYYPALVFLSFYLIENINQTKLIKFLSSISMEMFIIQFIPIYIVTEDLGLTSTFDVIVGVLILDIILAYSLHKLILHIRSKNLFKVGLITKYRRIFQYKFPLI